VLAVPVVPSAKTRLGLATKFGLGPPGRAFRKAGGLARAAGGGESKPARASRQAGAGWDMSRLCPCCEGKEVNF
jgi:hypothetical protein